MNQPSKQPDDKELEIDYTADRLKGRLPNIVIDKRNKIRTVNFDTPWWQTKKALAEGLGYEVYEEPPEEYKKRRRQE